MKDRRPRRRRSARNQQGSVLLLCLVFVALFGVVVAVMLSFGSASMKLNTSETTRSDGLYAADGAIQYGIGQAEQAANNGSCPADETGSKTLAAGLMKLPSDIGSVKLTCTQYTGTGSNSFGGYAIVAGVNQGTSTGAFTANTATCTSISSDPVGSGAPTFASGTRSCQKYPAGGTPPSWAQNVTPDITAGIQANSNITGDFVLTPTQQWFTGTHVVGGVTQPFVWFSSDGDDYADATGTGGSALPAAFTPTKIWAAGPSQVFVVGTQGGAGTVYLSSTTENATGGGVVTWSNTGLMTLPAGVKSLTNIYGLPGDPGDVWATGLNTSSVGAVWYFNGSSWTLSGTLANSTAAQGVWASDATHVWVVGTSTISGTSKGAVWSCTTAAAPCTTWSAATSLSNSTALLDINGLDATHIWAVGSGATRGVVTTFNGTTWAAIQQLTTTPTTSMTSVVAIDATHIWAVGSNGANATIWFCNGAGCTWRTSPEGVLPAATPAKLNHVSGVAVTDSVTGVTTYVLSAPGAQGTILVYAPLTAGNTCPVNQNCLSQVQGAVFNADTTNLVSGLQVISASFAQLQPSGGACNRPANLAPAIGDPPVPYTCPKTLPSSIMNISYPMPPAKPLPAANQAGTSVAPSVACPTGYTYFTPGEYSQEIDFSPHRTYFFESGVYLFDGNNPGFGAFDNLSSPPAANDLYVIGGKPSPGDLPTFANLSPCWNTIKANSAVWNGGTGTGVEWIMAKSTWLDVHTVNLELFTREGGNVATEGPQGLSVRDVSGVPTTGNVWSSDINNRPAPNMVLQVDANSPLHYPDVYVHGGIFLPNENVEEYTNPQPLMAGPVLGPIFAASIEFTYANVFQPPLVVSEGSPGAPTDVFTANAGPVTIQAFVPFTTADASTSPPTPPMEVTDPSKGYSWRVLNPT